MTWKWVIANQANPVARLYWSDTLGMWGGKAQATIYRQFKRNKEMPLCFLGAIWLKEF